MADIQRYPFARHLRGSATTHVRLQHKGKVRRQGVGQSFWFRPLSAVLSEVPVDDRELPMLFHVLTRDFQDVAVQATVTFRVVDADRAASRLDFSIDPGTGAWRAAPLQQLENLTRELAAQPAIGLLGGTTMRDALLAGPEPVRAAMADALEVDPRLTEIGVAVIGVRVVALRPEAEVERALQTPTREQVQQDADKATYERRAVAVERERAIAENELQNQIELALREEQLVGQRGQNERRRAQEAVAAEAITADGAAERERVQAAATAQATREIGEAKAAAEQAMLAAFAQLSPSQLAAIAMRDAATHLPEIGSLTLTPDLLTTLAAHLGGER